MLNFSGILSEYGEVFGEFLTTFLVLGSVSATVGLTLYILNSIGLFKMSKSLGLSNAWISFVPILSVFSLGRIAQRYIKRNGSTSAKFSVILLVLYILQLVLAVVFSVFLGLAIASIITNASSSIVNETAMTLDMFSAVIPVIAMYFVLFGITLAYTIIYYVALWRVFSIFNDSNATLFTVLSIFFKFLPQIFLFAVRNKEPKLTYSERLGIEVELVD